VGCAEPVFDRFADSLLKFGAYIFQIIDMPDIKFFAVGIIDKLGDHPRKNGKKESRRTVAGTSRSAISPEGRHSAVMCMQARSGTTLAALLTRFELEKVFNQPELNHVRGQ